MAGRLETDYPECFGLQGKMRGAWDCFILVDRGAEVSSLSDMSSGAIPKPYLQAWLRRTRRELAPSGRLSELAMILSQGDGQAEDFWRRRLSSVLDGEIEPDFELLTKVDSLLARPSRKPAANGGQEDLFE